MRCAAFNSDGRFLPEPADPTRAGSWYFWQLPHGTITTRAVAWTLYAAHQIAAWVLLYLQQRRYTLSLTRASAAAGDDAKSASVAAGTAAAVQMALPAAGGSERLGALNWAQLAVHAVFHALHLVQTHTTYDGLAPDTPEASSQGSVIMLLVFVLAIEFRDRGMLLGWPSAGTFGESAFTRRVSLNVALLYLVRKYHGYGFLWAAIYTMHYHPAEGTWGHAIGFMHTAFLMLQGGLAYTRAHYQRVWRLVLESWVIFHSGIVAWQTAGPALLGTALWPMFVFGFGMLFALTQVFTLVALWRRLPFGVRFVPLAVYVALLVYAYSWIPDSDGRPWVRMAEIVRIPGLEYLFVIVLFVLLWAATRIIERCLGAPRHVRAELADAATGRIVLVDTSASAGADVDGVEMKALGSSSAAPPPVAATGSSGSGSGSSRRSSQSEGSSGNDDAVREQAATSPDALVARPAKDDVAAADAKADYTAVVPPVPASAAGGVLLAPHSAHPQRPILFVLAMGLFVAVVGAGVAVSQFVLGIQLIMTMIVLVLVYLVVTVAAMMLVALSLGDDLRARHAQALQSRLVHGLPAA
jgi:hypothetical protein